MTFSKLGTDIDTQQMVYLPKASRLQGSYIVGLQGMGKSGLIENLIMEDINQQIGVCVLDPHGELINHVIARLEPKHEKDVIYLDLANDEYPFGLNLFTCPNLNSPKEVEKTVDRVMHIFDKLLGVSNETPLISQYLFHCTHTLVANPGYTMAEIPLLLTDKNCRQHLVVNVKRLQTRLFWQQYEQMKPSEQLDQLASLQRRVDKFLRDITLPIVGQSTSTIDMQKIMDERKIFLVKLDRTMEQATTLVGSIIVALILNASASRQTQRQFHLYADEFQRFATEDFATLIEEARKAAIGITMAHQNRAQLELSDKQADANLKARTLNVGNIVVFRVPTDASELAEQFDTTPPPAREEDIEIIDGEEEIKTPVKDVVHHLLNGGSHTNPVVTAFVNGAITNIKRKEARTKTSGVGVSTEVFDECYIAINNLFHKAMTTHDPSVFFSRIYPSYSSHTPLAYILYFQGIDWYASPFIFDDATHPYVPGFANSQQELDQSYDAMERMWRNPMHSPNYQIGFQYLQSKVNERFTDLINKYPSSQQEYYTNARQDKDKFVNFLEELKQVVQALAAQPIEVGSGLVRPRKRIQHIVHAQQSRADKEKEIAGQLLHLQKFTAWVKIAENIPQNPGKKCLKCGLHNKYGAKYCQGCGTHLPGPNEYIITTLQPPKGTQQLDQRIKRIQTYNLRDGYVKKREDVEIEIAQRQIDCSGFIPAQLQQPQQSSTPQQAQARHARQVPVQGKCPNCGAVNASNAKFCNQCGTKL